MRVAPSFRAYDFRSGSGGLLVPQRGMGVGSQSTGGFSANLARLQRFVVSEPMRLTRIGFEVVGVDAGDPAVDVGIYDAAFGLVASSGSTTGTCTSIGVKTVPLGPIVLTPGVTYWAAMSCASATPVFRTVASTGASGSALLLGSTAAAGAVLCTMAAALPLPSSVTPAYNSGAAVALALRSD